MLLLPLTSKKVVRYVICITIITIDSRTTTSIHPSTRGTRECEGGHYTGPEKAVRRVLDLLMDNKGADQGPAE